MTTPAGMRLDPRQVTMDEIEGYDETKRMLKAAVALALYGRHFMTDTHSSILLHGVTGAGKTLMARSRATTFPECTVYYTIGTTFTENGLGTNESNLRTMFTIAELHKPSIIILDWMEYLCGSGDSESSSAARGNHEVIKRELLHQMNLHQEVVMIGITDLPWMVDPAFVREFRTRIHIGLPDHDTRLAMLKLSLGKLPHAYSEEDLIGLAGETDGMTCDGIVVAVAQAIGLCFASQVMPSKHFLPTIWGARTIFFPCGASDQGAQEHEFESLGGDVYPEVALDDLKAALEKERKRSEAAQKADKKHMDWNESAMR